MANVVKKLQLINLSKLNLLLDLALTVYEHQEINYTLLNLELMNIHRSKKIFEQDRKINGKMLMPRKLKKKDTD